MFVLLKANILKMSLWLLKKLKMSMITKLKLLLLEIAKKTN